MIIGNNKETGESVNIDLIRLISTRLLIQANSGGGKSWLIRRLLEQTHGKIQQIVIDLEGEFSTLREKYDYLLVGKDGEIPANIQTAELLAIKLLKLNVSTIIDLSELKHHERITFVKRFLDSLINAPRELWHSCLVIVDEAHQFCPEGGKSESSGSVIDLQTRGRKRGFCGVLATQRIAKLHKDAAAECNNVLVGRTVIDIDRKRAANDLGFTTKEQELSLKKLDDGEFFGYGPAISKEDYIKVKIGGVDTTHPEPGKNIIKASKTPDNIKKLLKDVIDLPKEAEEEIRTTNDMKNKIRELTLKLRIAEHSKSNKIIDKEMLDKAKVQGHKEAEAILKRENDLVIKWFKKEIKDLQNTINSAKKVLEVTMNNLSPYEEKEKIIHPKIKVENKEIVDVPKIIVDVPQPVVEETRTYLDESELGICAKKIYSFLYNNPERSFERYHIGAFTGYSHKSGSFSNAISQLNSKDLIIKKGNSIQVKEMDSELAGEFDFSKEAIMGNLGVCPKKIYQLLLDNPYQEYSREEIGEQTGYSSLSGSFSNAISKLNSLGLIIKDNSHIKLNEELLET